MRTLRITFALFTLLIIGQFAQAQARLQIIHNSPDAAAAVVDVWLNNTKILTNFAFRTATPFIDAPSGVLLNIGIAPPNSTSWTQSLSIKQVVLTQGQTYIAMASGIISTTGYNPSPTFNLDVVPIGRESASQTGNTDVLAFHGSPDAPTVDVVETGAGAGTIINDFAYNDFRGYLELPTADYILDIRDSSGVNTVISYQAPLATLGLSNQALVLVASGFLNPAANNNGPAFGLFAALPTGGALVALPQYEYARVQVIHNSPDALASMVDIWLNDELLLDNFAFRQASPFVNAPAGMPFDITIAGPNSTDTTNAVARYTYTLNQGQTYVLIANGLVSQNGYAGYKPFNIEVYPMGREASSMSGNTDVLAFHGSPDAPVVDVVETGVGAGTIINNFTYPEFRGYLELPTADYTLEVRDSTGVSTVVSYQAPLASLGLTNQALVLVASGFLNPSANNNGPAFGLYAAPVSGGNMIPLPITVGMDKQEKKMQTKVYPNPARDEVSVRLTLDVPGKVRVSVMDLTGKTIQAQEISRMQAGQHEVQIPVQSIQNGTYLIVMENGSEKSVRKLQIVR